MFDDSGWGYILAIGGAIALVALAWILWWQIWSLVYFYQNRPTDRGYPSLRGPLAGQYSLWEVAARIKSVMQQYWEDRAAVDPMECPITGIHIFVGAQGQGKTYSAVRYITEIMRKYPATTFLSNIQTRIVPGHGFGETKVIKSWGEVQATGEYSTCVFLDEIQTWGSSLQSKQAPPELLALAAQQRKRKMMLIGTVQVPNRLIKPIREQVKLWYACRTWLGILTRVAVFDGDALNEEGKFVGKPKRVRWYIQTNAIRDSYDTLEIVDGADLSNWNTWNESGGSSGQSQA